MSSSADYRKELRQHFMGQVQKTKLQTSTAQAFQKRILSKQEEQQMDEHAQAQHKKQLKPEQKRSRNRSQPERCQHQQEKSECHHQEYAHSQLQPQPQPPVHQHQHICQPEQQQQQQQVYAAQPHQHRNSTCPQQLHQPKPVHHPHCCYFRQLPYELEKTYRIPQNQSKPLCRQDGMTTNGGDADGLIYENNEFNKGSHSPLNGSYSGGTSLGKSVKTLDFHRNNVDRIPPQSQHKAKLSTSQGMCNKAKLNSALQTAEAEAEGGATSADNATCSEISESSETTHRSSKTVISQKNGKELREVIHSHINFHNMIDKTLSALESNAADDITKTKSDGTIHTSVRPADKQTEVRSEANSPMRPNGIVKGHCHHCCIRTQCHRQIADMLRLEAGVSAASSTDPMMASVDEVVNMKVIHPIVRKLQRMYVNNLREEMSLLEDLERLPHMVSEVYRASASKKD